MHISLLQHSTFIPIKIGNFRKLEKLQEFLNIRIYILNERNYTYKQKNNNAVEENMYRHIASTTHF